MSTFSPPTKKRNKKKKEPGQCRVLFVVKNKAFAKKQRLFEVFYLMMVPGVLGAMPAAFASSVSMCIARA